MKETYTINNMDSKLNIVVIKITDRIKETGKLQKVLTKYGKVVKTRYGFHELNDTVCSRNALIILELSGELTQQEKLISDLALIGGIKTEIMKFDI